MQLTNTERISADDKLCGADYEPGADENHSQAFPFKFQTKTRKRPFIAVCWQVWLHCLYGDQLLGNSYV